MARKAVEMWALPTTDALGGAVPNRLNMAGGERAVQRETLKAFGLSHWQVANPRLRVRHSGTALASLTSENYHAT